MYSTAESGRFPPEPHTCSLNPTCRGNSVLAIAYKDGVLVASDSKISYGSYAKYLTAIRQYRLNKYCIIAYSGDSADFQFVQNFIECHQEDYRYQCGDQSADLKPKMVHSVLASFLYYRRSKLDPLWNTIVVAGLQPVEMEAGQYKPFIGVIQKHGTFYEVSTVATGFGSFLTHQLIESEVQSGKDISREQAINVLRKAMEVTYLRDSSASDEFYMSYIEKDSQSYLQLDKQSGNWDLCDKIFNRLDN